MKSDPRYIKMGDAAKRLGCTRPTIYAMLAREELTAIKIAGRILVTVESLTELLKARGQSHG